MATPIPSNRAAFNLTEVAQAVAGTAFGADVALRGVAIDSRAVQAGALFVAIRGEQHDGARFVEAAARAGAGALLVHAGTPCPEGVARVEVEDTTRALGDLAAFHRKRWGRLLVAITGSAGKTTTKELAAAALSATGLSVHKTQGNLNNQFGVPMTLLGLDDAHQAAVLELGTSGRGEIARLGEIAAPDVAAVLLAAAAHTEGIGSLSDVADEKASLWSSLAARGACVVNRDDAELWARRPEGVRCVSFGTSAESDVRLVGARITAEGTELDIAIEGEATLHAALKLLGRAAAIDACAALACVLAARGAEMLSLAAQGLVGVLPTPGRMQPHALASGVLVLDDTYNANPSSMQMSLTTLKALTAEPGTRSVAVVSDMLELGERSALEHAQLGEFCVRQGIDLLVGCGPEMAHATTAAARLSAGRLAPHPTRVAHVFDPIEAARLTRGLLRKGDVVLVKGSRSMAMERVVSALCRGEAEVT